mmetsp:Transcript_5860/g.9518  ORF Transcript_5860/g.9518 Transcript_5860/m.9518 type:complete len:210 (+) Transcript_5860:304-933(+)
MGKEGPVVDEMAVGKDKVSKVVDLLSLDLVFDEEHRGDREHVKDAPLQVFEIIEAILVLHRVLDGQTVSVQQEGREEVGSRRKEIVKGFVDDLDAGESLDHRPDRPSCSVFRLLGVHRRSRLHERMGSVGLCVDRPDVQGVAVEPRSDDLVDKVVVATVRKRCRQRHVHQRVVGVPLGVEAEIVLERLCETREFLFLSLRQMEQLVKGV